MSKVRLLIIASLALATAFGLRGLQQFVEWARPLTLAIVIPGGHVTPAERALRPNYPYSVIPGGVYSPEELRNSTDRDGVIRAHYADFDLKSTRLVTLASDRYQYVSYRVKNKVYWTNYKLRIPKGEVLLTDGVHFARTRCGNRLCAAFPKNTFLLPSFKPLVLPPFTTELLSKGQVALPAAPAIAEEIGPGLEFELPRLGPYVPPPGPLPPAAENWPPVNVPPNPVPILPGLPLVPITPTPIPPSPPPISSVPEPASLYLLLLGCAVSLWFVTRRMRVNFGTTEDGN
jgi:hypothetical protein